MSKSKIREKLRKNLRIRGEEARTVRKIVVIILISLILIFLIGGISAFMYINSALNPVDPESNEEIRVEIPVGSSTTEIAAILEENGVIKNATIFGIYTKFNNASNFQAGDYVFTPAMTLDEITEALQNGRVTPIHTITIQEGLTLEEIAEIYADELHFSKEDFLDIVNDRTYVEQLIDAYPNLLSEDILDPDIRTPLEGYLFASTYEFYEQEPSIESIIERMLDKTESVVSNYLDEIDAQGLSVHQAITFASLVEQEARTEDQRRRISGVFYNRLEEGIKLQTDPTVLYALGEHKDRVLYEDLEIESPYNTYHTDGLPIGPIGNFAENSLEAVVHPEESDYLYFLHDGEGNIYFSESYDDHLEKREEHIIDDRENEDE